MRLSKAPGIFAAVVGLSAVVTAGFGWAEVLAGWMVCALLRWMKKGDKSLEFTGRSSVLVMIIGTLLIGVVVQGAEKAFPGDETFPFVSSGLMLLLYKMLSGEKDTTTIVTNVLGPVLLGLLGSLVLFGFENVQWSENIPNTFRWDGMVVSFVIFSPWWAGKTTGDGKWFFCSGLVTVGMSLVSRGILGGALTEYTSLPLYKAVQTIHVLGTLQRLEAILAAAVLLGAFSMMGIIGTYVLEAANNLFPETKNKIWLMPLLMISFFAEYVIMHMDDGIKQSLTTIFWGVLPVFVLWIVICKKDKKVLDKMDEMM